MSLVQAIDHAVAYVRAHDEQMTRTEEEDFRRLAEAVYVLAAGAGLLPALPQVAELRPQLESDQLALPPIQFTSKLNLPGIWHSIPSPDSLKDDLLPSLSWRGDLPAVEDRRVFLVYVTPRWFQDMATLRAIAEAGQAKADCLTPPTEKIDRNPTDDWADFRDTPGGPLLTPKYCKKRFNVSGKDLSLDAEAKKTRRRNPAGRAGGDYVYRYDVVARIANRKTGYE